MLVELLFTIFIIMMIMIDVIGSLLKALGVLSRRFCD